MLFRSQPERLGKVFSMCLWIKVVLDTVVSLTLNSRCKALLHGRVACMPTFAKGGLDKDHGKIWQDQCADGTTHWQKMRMQFDSLCVISLAIKKNVVNFFHFDVITIMLLTQETSVNSFIQCCSNCAMLHIAWSDVMRVVNDWNVEMAQVNWLLRFIHTFIDFCVCSHSWCLVHFRALFSFVVKANFRNSWCLFFCSSTDSMLNSAELPSFFFFCFVMPPFVSFGPSAKADDNPQSTFSCLLDLIWCLQNWMKWLMSIVDSSSTKSLNLHFDKPWGCENTMFARQTSIWLKWPLECPMSDPQQMWKGVHHRWSEVSKVFWCCCWQCCWCFCDSKVVIACHFKLKAFLRVLLFHAEIKRWIQGSKECRCFIHSSIWDLQICRFVSCMLHCFRRLGSHTSLAFVAVLFVIHNWCWSKNCGDDGWVFHLLQSLLNPFG